MTANDLPILGISNNGRLILGGFFTAHDTHGYHTDWFMAHALKTVDVSIPYFACELLQHPNRDPDLIWSLLENGYSEAKIKMDWEKEREKLRFFLYSKWAEFGKPSLRGVALRVMEEMRENGKTLQAWISEVNKAIP